MKPVTIAVALLASFAAALPTAAPPVALAKANPIRGVRDPIYHLYLQALPGSPTSVVLGPEASQDTFNINASIQSVKTGSYLNIVDATTSYKPLTWGKTAVTTAWGLEGDTIITKQGSKYGRQLNFLACKAATNGYYEIFLQTGNDVPAGKTCSNYQTIHLPCLC